MSEIVKRKSNPTQIEAITPVVENGPGEPALGEEQIGGILDEVLAWIKDDRMNTVRAISSDAASRKMVQKQNHELVMACSATLQREGSNLTIAQKLDLIDKMSEATTSTERVDARSRTFQHEQLSHSHRRSKQLPIFVMAMMLGVGGAAWYLNRAA